MKMEDQVCTLGQAMKLKKAGVEQRSYFSYHFKTYQLMIATLSLEIPQHWQNNLAAFTSAELGKMLPPYTITKYTDRIEKWSAIHYFNGEEIVEDAETEAQARAELLLRLLSNPKYLYTLEEVNEKLIQ